MKSCKKQESQHNFVEGSVKSVHVNVVFHSTKCCFRTHETEEGVLCFSETKFKSKVKF